MLLPNDMGTRINRIRKCPSDDGPKKRHPKEPAPLNDDTEEEDNESDSDQLAKESDGESSSIASDTSDTSLTEWRNQTGGLREETKTSTN